MTPLFDRWPRKVKPDPSLPMLTDALRLDLCRTENQLLGLLIVARAIQLPRVDIQFGMFLLHWPLEWLHRQVIEANAAYETAWKRDRL